MLIRSHFAVLLLLCLANENAIVIASLSGQVFMLRLDMEDCPKAEAKVLIVLQTKALYNSTPCLKEIHAAIKNHVTIIPVRMEEDLPSKAEQWLKMSASNDQEDVRAIPLLPPPSFSAMYTCPSCVTQVPAHPLTSLLPPMPFESTAAAGDHVQMLAVSLVKKHFNKLNSIPARGTLLEQLPTELPRLLQLVKQAHGIQPPPPPAVVSEHTMTAPPAAMTAPAVPAPAPAPEAAEPEPELTPAPAAAAAAAAAPLDPSAAAAVGLDAFLQGLNLQKYAEQLKTDLGAATPADLKDLEDGDMDDLGMKKLEKKRLVRALEAL